MTRQLLLILFSVIFCQPVLAQRLAVVVNTWPPYVEQTLPGKGLALQIVKEALARKNYQVSVTFETWPRALEGLDVGLFDLVGAIWKTPERDKSVVFSRPYLTNHIKFIKQKHAPIDYQDLDDLNGYLIGVVRDYAYEEAFNQSKKLIKIPQNHIIQNLQKLNNGEIDLTLGDDRALRYEINHYMPGRNEAFAFLDKPLSKRGLRIGVSRQNKQAGKIIEDFNRAIEEMQADGSLQTLIRAY